MSKLTIAYDFVFSLTVKKKRNEKVYNNHSIVGLGTNYNNAVWDVYLKLKKRQSTILKINRVKVLRIAFAVKDGEFISLNLEGFPPHIPEDLNSAVSQLPKN